MHEKQESHQHDQNKEHQFGVSGAHALSLLFPAIAAIRCSLHPLPWPPDGKTMAILS
jgi:hypothetical protein